MQTVVPTEDMATIYRETSKPTAKSKRAIQSENEKNTSSDISFLRKKHMKHAWHQQSAGQCKGKNHGETPQHIHQFGGNGHGDGDGECAAGSNSTGQFSSAL